MSRSAEFWEWFETVAAPKLASGKGGLATRATTFRAMFEHLDAFDRPVLICETGCTRDSDNFGGDGCSTLLFDKYCDLHPGSLVHSVDIDPVAAGRCRKAVCHTLVETGDSVRHLAMLAHDGGGAFDLVYLDSFDMDWTAPLASQAHHLAELHAILPACRDDTLIAVDDSPVIFEDGPRVEIGGKGALVARFAEEAGADLVFSAYQAGWTGMTRKPDRSDASVDDLIARARAHVEAGRSAAASSLYRRVIALTAPPWTGLTRIARGEACAFMARTARDSGQTGTAIDWYLRAIECDPLATDYRVELATRCLANVGALDMAAVEATRASNLAPDDPVTWSALGGIEHERGEAQRAVAAYDREMTAAEQIGDADTLAGALLDRASVALDVEDYALVNRLAASVIAMDGARKADAYHVAGMAAYREGCHEDAIDLFTRAIANGCRDVPLARWHRSQALHSIGRYRDGWIDHEARIDQQQIPALSLPLLRFNRPLWKGERPPATIHVHAEAGAGDNLCLVRYLNLLTERGYAVRYECQDGMDKLMRDSFPGVEIVPRAKDYPGAVGIKPFDYHVPIGSLPAVFETDIDSVPWSGPYLKADPDLVAHYRLRVPRGAVGLVWSSGIREDSLWLKRFGALKSMALYDLGPVVTAADDVSCISLQVGPERALSAGFSRFVRDVLPEKPTWADTAALIECLDLVVTVDTGVSHLAGAMGKPVWLMMHSEGSWHYMAERPGASWNTASPWYPSTRIFRQKKRGEWGPVVADIAEALKERIDGRRYAHAG